MGLWSQLAAELLVSTLTLLHVDLLCAPDCYLHGL